MMTPLRTASALLVAAVSLSTTLLHAAALPNRLSRTSASTEMQALPQGVSARVKHSTALGHLSGDTKMETMSLVLAPSAAQDAALTQLLSDQQNPSSPRYHQWLTPAQFGAQFGVSDSDLKVLQNWLTNQGLQVASVAPSRNRIQFSGTAATVEAAFHTEMDQFRRNGQTFFENGTALAIPAGLQNVVAGITGLTSYRMHPALHRAPVGDASSLIRSGSGQHAQYNSASGNHYMTPYDFRQVYNANGLFNSGYTGANVGIAVLGQSAIDPNQITYFQQLTGQTTKAPTLVLVPNTGVSTAYTGDETESEADLEYASGVAPGATVTFVYAGSSNNASVADALNYAITNDIAPILTYSYGGCETENSVSSLLSQETYFRQANAQGQTVLVASGDTGAAGCDYGVTTAYDGLQVGYPASSPYITAIGGTQFDDSTGNYWASSNNSQSGSALGYIPESAWNENSSDPLAASGGGASRVFGKPNWQAGTGVPADGARDVPDISFTAAEHDAYVVCTSDSSYTSTSNGVTQTAACTSTAFGIGRVGGTSLPTPSFAGALAIVLNANNNTAGLGNLNPLLYGLASSTPSIFHDITTGSNLSPCVAGTQGCVNGSLGYNATTGYDQATGLGSLDLGGFSTNLTTGNAGVSKVASIALTATQANTTTITVQGIVSSSSGTTPSGTVVYTLDGGSAQTATLTAAGVSTATFTGTFTAGTHTVKAVYSGDANFAGGSASTTITVSTTNGGLSLAATPSTLTIASSTMQKGSWTLNLTSTNGYSGIVGYSVSAVTGSSTPSVGCFYGQGDVGVASNATVSSTVTFSLSNADCQGTNVIRAFGSTRKVAGGTAAPLQRSNLPLLAVGFTGLLGSAALRRRKAWMTGLLALAAFAGTAGLSGCGSGSNPLPTSTTGGTGGNAGSLAKGTYNLVFTAADYLNQTPTATTNVTLVIQ